MYTKNVRRAKKAGDWYASKAPKLAEDLTSYLGAVPDTIDGVSLPITEARIIIAPHAGYEYSGPCAAWSYKCLDVSRAKRVFILGPSHTYYLGDCAISQFDEWATPFGNLTVDTEVLQEIKQAGEMGTIPEDNDTEEHSMEMQAPYLYMRFQQTFSSPEKFPKIVPILVGSLSRAEEKAMGRVLLPYLKDPENAFVVSSDFCHWGSRFSYMAYSPDNNPVHLHKLRLTDRRPVGIPIHESIRLIDEHSMDAVESGSHDAFLQSLKTTKNTVCGRHPIGVAMAALELYAKEVDDKTKARFKVLQYRRSNFVECPGEHSVSYVAAYALLPTELVCVPQVE